MFFQAVFKVHPFGFFFFFPEETGRTPSDRGCKYCHRRPDEIKQTIPSALTLPASCAVSEYVKVTSVVLCLKVEKVT